MPVTLESKLGYVPKRNTLTLAKCFQVIRLDGKQFNYTDHDVSLTVNGIVFSASNSIMSSAAEQEAGLTGGNAELQGFIASENIRHDELVAGLFNNAKVIIYVVDWKYPFGGPIQITEFVITTLTYNNNHWKAAVEGYSNHLASPVGKVATRLCPYAFGEKLCGLDTTLYTSQGTEVLDVTSDGYNNRQTIKLKDSFITDKYNLGSLVFTTGANALIKYDIAFNSFQDVTLYMQAGFDIEVGDSLYMVEGCDRNYTTCSKFNNINRFGGFPFIIGADKMFTTPDRKDANG